MEWFIHLILNFEFQEKKFNIEFHEKLFLEKKG